MWSGHRTFCPSHPSNGRLITLPIPQLPSPPPPRRVIVPPAPPCTGSLRGAQTAATFSLPAGHKVAVPSAMANRRSGSIVLDARLDEDAWKSATPITEFRQVDPDEGKAGTERTD